MPIRPNFSLTYNILLRVLRNSIRLCNTYNWYAIAKLFTSNSSDSNINASSYFIFRTELRSASLVDQRCIPVRRNSKDLQFHAPTLPHVAALFFSLSSTLALLFLTPRPIRKHVSDSFLFNFVLYILYDASHVHAHTQLFIMYTHHHSNPELNRLVKSFDHSTYFWFGQDHQASLNAYSLIC